MEEVVRLLLHLLVGHLLHPGGAHICLAGGVFVSKLIILSFLDHKCVSKVGEVLCVLIILAVASVVSLVVELVH